MKISRRDFLKYCISSAAILGLDATVLGKLSKAFANAGPHIIWLSGSACTGCSVSLANLISPTAPVDVADLLINVVNLDFHPNLMGASGDNAVQALRSAAEGSYVLAVEGGIPSAFNGNACILWNENGNNVTALSAVQDLASHSIANLAIGTCASYGGVPAAAPNPTQAASLSSAIGRPTINIPGCPTHPDWVVWTIAQLIAGVVPALDNYGRPSVLFGGENNNVHRRCPRREREEADTYGVPNLCLEELGCRGPETQGDCPVRKWNNQRNYCMNANALCIGCTESNFPSGRFFRVATTSTIPVQKAFAVNSTSWDSNNLALTIIGTGKIGSQAVVKTISGELIAASMINRDGTWAISKTGLTTVPSSVVASSNGTSISVNISDAPPAGQTFAITGAQYISNTNQLSVSGTGTAGTAVTLSIPDGTLLGTVTIPANGNWALTVTSPSPVPSTVIAVANGVTLRYSVQNVPPSTQRLTITLAEYDAGRRRLNTAGQGVRSKSVRIYNASSGRLIGTAYVSSSGRWSRSISLSRSSVPERIRVTSNNETAERIVERIGSERERERETSSLILDEINAIA